MNLEMYENLIIADNTIYLYDEECIPCEESMPLKEDENDEGEDVIMAL